MGFVNYVATKMCDVAKKSNHRLHTKWYGSGLIDRRVLVPTTLADDLGLGDRKGSPLLYLLGLRSVSTKKLNEVDIPRDQLIHASRFAGGEYTKKLLIKMLIHKAHKGSKFNEKRFSKNYKDTMKLYDAMLGVEWRCDEKKVNGHAVYQYQNFPCGEDGIDSNTTVALIGIGQGAASQKILHDKRMEALVTVTDDEWIRVDSRQLSSWYSDDSVEREVLFSDLI